MASEWWTSPSEAARRLDAVRTLWNGVQNAALGRSTRPNVSDALAKHIVAETTAFREFADQVEGWQWGVQWADELTDWSARANAARARVEAELAAKGADVPVPAPVTEWHEIGPQAVASVFAGAAGLALGIGAIALVVLLRGKGRR